ncbi:MAG: DUF2461 domain-containing protein [Cyclobacteriaceae bacterium]
MSRELLEFLGELSLNNNKEWMDDQRVRYLELKDEFLDQVGLILAFLSKQDAAFSVLRPKDCVFRQNRDVRFSANKQPYKTNMSAYFAVGGKKSEGPGYYLHVQPGESFLAGGIWMPTPEILKKIRQEIDYSGKDLESILSSREIKSNFGCLEGDQLKTSPRDYDKNHPYIHFLKYKSFILTKKIPDAGVFSGELVPLAQDAFLKMNPFMAFLAKAVEQGEDGSGLL